MSQLSLTEPQSRTLELEGGWVRLDERVFDDERMQRLLNELSLTVADLTIFGRTYKTPRLTGWYGEPGASYTYSGAEFEPLPWTKELRSVLARVRALDGTDYNSCLCNFYRDGRDTIGWHSDNEDGLGPTPDDVRICSVSFGAPRRFLLRHRTTKETHTFRLGFGSVLVMGGALQRTWAHHVPRTSKPVGPRLNLTFRVVV